MATIGKITPDTLVSTTLERADCSAVHRLASVQRAGCVAVSYLHGWELHASRVLSKCSDIVHILFELASEE